MCREIRVGGTFIMYTCRVYRVCGENIEINYYWKKNKRSETHDAGEM